MPNLVVLAELPFATKAAKDTALEKLTKLGQFVKENEPDTLQYCFCASRDISNENVLYVIEGYSSQEAVNTHTASDPAKNMMAWLSENPQNLGGQVTVNIAEEYTFFTRPEIADTVELWICYSSIEFRKGKRANALDSWKHVIPDIEKNRADTLSYNVLKDKGHPEVVRTLEVYAGEKYIPNVHELSTAVGEDTKEYVHVDDVRISTKPVILKFQGGFWTR